MNSGTKAIEHIMEILTIDNDKTSYRYAWLRQSDRDHLQKSVGILTHWIECMAAAEKGTK